MNQLVIHRFWTIFFL